MTTNDTITNDQGETREEGIRRLTRDVLAGRRLEDMPAAPIFDPAGEQDQPGVFRPNPHLIDYDD